MLSDPPQFGEIRAGWYQINGYWYLTFDAAKQELEITTKSFKELILCKHVLTETLFNQYNRRPFVVYCLADMRCLKRQVSTGK